MKAVQEKKRLSLLVPDWNVPSQVLACTTMRQRLVEGDAYAGFNLATHVGDDQSSVEKNRQELMQALALTSKPVWLQQTHSTQVINLDELDAASDIPQADAVFTTQKNRVCVILTADCLPLIVTDKKGRGVLAIHAGWRGLADGIIRIAIKKFAQSLDIQQSECSVWLGPAIGQKNFEVGSDVYRVFVDKSQEAKKAFIHKENDKYLCDLYHLARLELETLGIEQISGGEHCTYAQEEEFYSYRRHIHQLNQVAKSNAATNLPSFLRADDTKIKSFTKDCGRQATLICLSDNT